MAEAGSGRRWEGRKSSGIGDLDESSSGCDACDACATGPAAGAIAVVAGAALSTDEPDGKNDPSAFAYPIGQIFCRLMNMYSLVIMLCGQLLLS